MRSVEKVESLTFKTRKNDIYIRAVKRLKILIRLITGFCGLQVTFFRPDVHAHAGIRALRRARRRSESC